MTDYWGIPEQEYELSLLQFARKELSEMGYSVIGEKVEVCSGAGALTLTALIKTKDSMFTMARNIEKRGVRLLSGRFVSCQA